VTWPELMAATSLAADTGIGLLLETPKGSVPPSGNQVSFAYADVLQARDGRFVSHRMSRTASTGTTSR